MIVKELLDHRWKLLGGLALSLATVVGNQTLPRQLANAQDPALRAGLAEALRDPASFVWDTTFNPLNGLGLMLLFLAALIGASLVAGEVTRGTIFVLLSRPLARDHLLLTKYAVGAAALLAVILAVTVLVLMLTPALLGQPLHAGGTLVSALLLWLGTLFVLGLATLFSVVLSDPLRPLALTVLVLVLLSILPSLLGLSAAWVLPAYWTNLPAFLGQEFPVWPLVVGVIAAAVPLLAALLLFRRRQY